MRQTTSAHLNPSPEYLAELQHRAIAEKRQCLVGGLIVDSNGKLFFQRRAHHRKYFPGSWDVAGGKVEPSETLTQALAREIAEETGWKLIRILAIVEIFDWENSDGSQKTRVREFAFLVQVDGDLQNPQIERTKFSEFRWFGKSELNALLENRQSDDRVMFRLAEKAFAVFDMLTPTN